MPTASEDPRLTEARNPRTEGIDRADAREIVARIQAEDRAVPTAVAAQADAIAEMVELVASRLRRGGRLFYVGAGTSGRLGVLDASECPPTFSTDPRMVQGIIAGGSEALTRSREGVEDDEETGRRAIREAGVNAVDFVLGIAASGTTPFVRAALEEAAGRGAGLGFLSCTEPPPALRERMDVVVTPLTGPEVIAGSTRMKAGTATKLVLNTLTTAVMIRLGKVYGNLMVDLRAASLKLVDRSLRIVQEAGDVDRERARRLLVAAGGSAKTAVVMARLRTDRYTAEVLLDACDGFLAEVLDRWRPGDRFPEYACYPATANPEEMEEIVERLRHAPERVRTALSASTGGVPPAGGWSPPEHVAHLLEFETAAIQPRLRAIQGGPEAEAPAFPDWRASAAPPLAERPAEELADRFGAERARTVALLPPADADAFRRSFRIGEEEVTLYQLLRGLSHHDGAHVLRMEERVHPALLRPGVDPADEPDGGAPPVPPADGRDTSTVR